MTRQFERLVADAEATPFSGWDFSWLRGRVREDPLPWDLRELVRERMRRSERAIDLGTGGGEFLSSCAPLAPQTVATEGWPPNVAIAARRLLPLGVPIVATAGSRDNCDQPDPDDRSLPFVDATFDLVISRHEAYAPHEITRVLRPSGTFLTQQVGGDDDRELVVELGGRAPACAGMTLHDWPEQLETAGLRVTRLEEARDQKTFGDIGALVYYVRAISWLVPGFSLATHRAQLLALHERITRSDGLPVTRHRLLIEAVP